MGMPVHSQFPVVESNTSGCTTNKQDPPKIQTMSSISFPNLDVNYLSVCHMDYLVYMIIISSHEYKITMLLNNSDNMNDFEYNKICLDNPNNINLINNTVITYNYLFQTLHNHVQVF